MALTLAESDMQERAAEYRFDGLMQISCAECGYVFGFTVWPVRRGEAVPMARPGVCGQAGCDGLWLDVEGLLHLNGWQYRPVRKARAEKPIVRRVMAPGWY